MVFVICAYAYCLLFAHAGAVEAEESESESDDAGAGAGAGDDNRRTKKHKTNDTSTDVTHALQQPQQHTPAAAAAASAPVTGQVNDDVMMTDQLADHESSMKEAADIQRVLLRRILPALHKQLVLEEEEVVRAPVAIAMVKLLKVSTASLCSGWHCGHYVQLVGDNLVWDGIL